MAISAAVTKTTVTLLSNEKFRKSVGWTLVAIFSLIILLIALLCAIGSGGRFHQ